MNCQRKWRRKQKEIITFYNVCCNLLLTFTAPAHKIITIRKIQANESLASKTIFQPTLNEHGSFVDCCAPRYTHNTRFTQPQTSKQVANNSKCGNLKSQIFSLQFSRHFHIENQHTSSMQLNIVQKRLGSCCLRIQLHLFWPHIFTHDFSNNALSLYFQNTIK